MAWNLAGARERYGVVANDTSGDTMLLAQMFATQNIADLYCHRWLLYKDDDVIHSFRHTSSVLQLPRFPLSPTIPPIVMLNDTVVDYGYQVDEVRGKILFDYQLTGPKLTVTFAGGYHTDEASEPQLPYDVELALYGILDAIVARQDYTSTTTGGIESVTIPDVGTMRFGANNAQTGVIGGPASLADSYMLLDPYVVELA
jgi:hypothetical protein